MVDSSQFSIGKMVNYLVVKARRSGANLDCWLCAWMIGRDLPKACDIRTPRNSTDKTIYSHAFLT